MSRRTLNTDTLFPIAVIVALTIFKATHRHTLMLLPYCIWIAFLGLLLEPESSWSARYLRPVFSNRLSAWLGKISYSVYLSHALVLIVVQWGLFRFFPQATQRQHLAMLTLLTLVFTIAASSVLYYAIEAPCIRFGKRLYAKTDPH